MFPRLVLDSTVTFFVLAGLYPVAFLVSRNWFVYESRQLLFLLVVPCITGLLGIIAAAAVGLMKRAVWNGCTRAWRPGISRMVLCMIGFLLLYTLLEASISDSKKVILGLAICAGMVCLMTKKAGFYPVNIVLLIMTLMAFGWLIRSVSTRSINNDYLIPGLNKEADDAVRFTTTPSIYLIHLESYHSPAAMKRLYDFENKEFTGELSAAGFFVSENNFANYSATLTSIGAMFLQHHHYNSILLGVADAVGVRDMVGGRLYNPTLEILKNNGYKIVYLHTDTYNFMGSDSLDSYYPPNCIHDSLLIFQSDRINKLRAMIFGIRKPDARMTASSGAGAFREILYNALKKERADSKPCFYYIKYAGAKHTPPDGSYSWKNSGDGWTGEYIHYVKDANPLILELVHDIVANDPSAIVIIYGDHGAWKYRNIWAGGSKEEDVNQLIFDRGSIDGEVLALDLFGTFLAVRFPNGNSRLLDGETPVNMFRKLFSDLSGNSVLFRDKPSNNSYLERSRGELLMLVRDGTALKRIEKAVLPR